MRINLIAIGLIALFAGTTLSQDNAKPWSAWSKKDAEKILNDSAWGQSQSIGGTDPTSTSAITATQGAGRESINRTGESGETIGGAKPLNVHARFLTAKPVRAAFARIVVLSQPNAGKDLIDQLQGFIDRDFGNYLVVSVSVDSADQRLAAASMGAFGKMTVNSLKDKVYLERKDGKRLALIDYKAPINDGLGAKFIFERNLDGQPFLTDSSDLVRFYLEASDKMKINLRFRVASMMYAGKLEY